MQWLCIQMIIDAVHLLQLFTYEELGNLRPITPLTANLLLYSFAYGGTHPEKSYTVNHVDAAAFASEDAINRLSTTQALFECHLTASCNAV